MSILTVTQDQINTTDKQFIRVNFHRFDKKLLLFSSIFGPLLLHIPA